MPVVLRPVTITKHETCLSYAFKRIGKDIPEGGIFAEVVKKEMSKTPYFFATALSVGNILVWDKGKDHSVPMEIDGNGRLISKPSYIGFHCGVVEEISQYGILVSDCTRLVYPNHHPCIRVRKLKEIESMPDYIIF